MKGASSPYRTTEQTRPGEEMETQGMKGFARGFLREPLQALPSAPAAVAQMGPRPQGSFAGSLWSSICSHTALSPAHLRRRQNWETNQKCWVWILAWWWPRLSDDIDCQLLLLLRGFLLGNVQLEAVCGVLPAWFWLCPFR